MPRPDISVPRPSGVEHSETEKTTGKYALMLLVIVITVSIAGSINLATTIGACASILGLASVFFVKNWHPSKK